MHELLVDHVRTTLDLPPPTRVHSKRCSCTLGPHPVCVERRNNALCYAHSQTRRNAARTSRFNILQSCANDDSGQGISPDRAALRNLSLITIVFPTRAILSRSWPVGGPGPWLATIESHIFCRCALRSRSTTPSFMYVIVSVLLSSRGSESPSSDSDESPGASSVSF